MECYCYLRDVQDLVTDVNTLYERRFGEPFKGPAIPLGTRPGSMKLVRKCYLGYSLGMHRMRGELGRKF